MVEVNGNAALEDVLAVEALLEVAIKQTHYLACAEDPRTNPLQWHGPYSILHCNISIHIASVTQLTERRHISPYMPKMEKTREYDQRQHDQPHDFNRMMFRRIVGNSDLHAV